MSFPRLIMKKKQTLNQDILILSILTLFTVLTWIAFDVLRTLRKPTVPEVLKEQLTPLNPNFDTETLESLKQKLSISEEELNSVPENITIEFAKPTESPSTPSGERRKT